MPLPFLVGVINRIRPVDDVSYQPYPQCDREVSHDNSV